MGEIVIDFQDNSNSEHESTQAEVDALKSELLNKVDSTKMKSVWDQLGRFAEYDDLKKLHSLVVPEIAKFEHKIIQSEKTLKSFEQMLRNFDEVI